jgi:hypothetical protein
MLLGLAASLTVIDVPCSECRGNRRRCEVKTALIAILDRFGRAALPHLLTDRNLWSRSKSAGYRAAIIGTFIAYS